MILHVKPLESRKAQITSENNFFEARIFLKKIIFSFDKMDKPGYLVEVVSAVAELFH